MSLNLTLALGDPPGQEEWDGEHHPNHARPWPFHLPVPLHAHSQVFSSLGLIQLALRPSEKLLLIPATQVGSLGRGPGGKQAGYPVWGSAPLPLHNKTRDMLAEGGGDPSKQSLAPQPDILQSV